ncbi:MAG TPA: extensin family protein, partial [Steroidobacter sp.]|nr:extensin family protein [Steroidobacter sp.]
LEGGQRIRVLKDWEEDENGAFLKEIRTGACRFFDGVLSPDYNAAHRDHFHFDRGPYRVCR